MDSLKNFKKEAAEQGSPVTTCSPARRPRFLPESLAFSPVRLGGSQAGPRVRGLDREGRKCPAGSSEAANSPALLGTSGEGHRVEGAGL